MGRSSGHTISAVLALIALAAVAGLWLLGLHAEATVAGVLSLLSGSWWILLVFNKEVLLFVWGSLWLAAMALQIHDRPDATRTGKQTVAENRPARVAVTVEELARSEQNELNLYAYGPRPNPFNLYWAEEAVQLVRLPGDPRPRPRQRTKQRPKRSRHKVSKPKRKPKPTDKPTVTQAKPTVTQAKPVRKARPYELPVEYRGWIAIGDDLVAHLRDKANGKLLQVRQGDQVPDLGLTILSVGRAGVILENDKGDRFLLRELLSENDDVGVPDAAAPKDQKDGPPRGKPQGGDRRGKRSSPRHRYDRRLTN